MGCHWDEDQCWSAVGNNPCNYEQDNSDDREDDEYDVDDAFCYSEWLWEDCSGMSYQTDYCDERCGDWYGSNDDESVYWVTCAEYADWEDCNDEYGDYDFDSDFDYDYDFDSDFAIQALIITDYLFETYDHDEDDTIDTAEFYADLDAEYAAGDIGEDELTVVKDMINAFDEADGLDGTIWKDETYVDAEALLESGDIDFEALGNEDMDEDEAEGEAEGEAEDETAEDTLSGLGAVADEDLPTKEEFLALVTADDTEDTTVLAQ